MIDEIKDYLMAFGTSKERSEEIVQNLIKNNEIDQFYANM